VVLLFALFTTNFVPQKFSSSEISKRNLQEKVDLNRQLNDLEAATGDGMTVFIGAQIQMAGMNPWTQGTFLRGQKLLGLGWGSQSPHQETRKKGMGLQGNFVKKLSETPETYVLTNQHTADLLSYSYLRRNNERLTFKIVKSFDFGVLYQVTKPK
jgi:hypothetical protein